MMCPVTSDLSECGWDGGCAGALEMTAGPPDELEGLPRSHTAHAREVRWAKALFWAAMLLVTAAMVRLVRMSKKVGVVSTSRRSGASTIDDGCSTKSSYYFGTNYPRE